jgi:hypothetical protein
MNTLSKKKKKNYEKTHEEKNNKYPTNHKTLEQKKEKM